MSLAKILAVVDSGPGSEAAVTAALDLGLRFSAGVELLHIAIDAETSVPMIGEGMSSAAAEQLVQNLRAEAQNRLREAQRLFEVHRVAAALPVVEPNGATEAGAFAVCFRHVVDREVDQVLRYGRLSDLIVMARPGAESKAGLSAAFDAALFDSGRAVLLVPAEPVTGLGATVAVAWERSREAARTGFAWPSPARRGGKGRGRPPRHGRLWAQQAARDGAGRRHARHPWRRGHTGAYGALIPMIVGMIHLSPRQLPEARENSARRCSDARRNAILRLNWFGAISYSWRRTAKPPWYGPSAEPGGI